MDNYLGPLIILILAVASVVGQVVESRKKKEQNKESELRGEDMPEATRRMLYGDGDDVDIPMAKPKQNSQPAVPPPPPPPRRQTQAAPQAQAPQRRQVPEQRAQRPAPVRRQPQVQQRTEAAPKRRSVRDFIPPEARRRVQETLQEVWRQAQQAGQVEVEPEDKPPAERPARPAQRSEAAPSEMRSKTRQRSEQRQPVRTSAPATRKKKRPAHPLMRGLIDSPKNVRRGIVLREILGPPKGL